MSKLVGIKTYERFRSLWENDAIDDFSINFIIDTGQLYTHGIFINGAVFGTAANDAVSLSIAGITNTLALSSHTHSNYLEKNVDIDISNYKIKSGNKDLLFYSGGSLYLGNDASPTYISGSNLYSVRGNTVHEILDTSNFSISNTLPTGYTYNNTAYIRYGSNSHQIDYVKRINTSQSFDYLNTYTQAGTNILNGIQYGYITLYTDNIYTNPSWAQLRINIPNKVMQFRTSADPNNWIGLGVPTIPNNALNVAGIVAAPNSTTINKVWKTDESGNPAWRDEKSYTFSNLKFQQISGTDLMTYNTQATKTILAGSNISFTHDNGVLTIKAQDTTYGVVSKTSAGLTPQLPNETTTTKFLRQDGTWATPTYTSDTNTWRPIKVNGTEKRGTAITSGDLNFINGSNTTVEWTSDNKLKINSTWTAWKGATNSANGTAGYMPAPTSAQRGQFLRGDGSWVSLNNYSLPTASNSTLGGVKTGAAITDTTGYTAVAIKDGIIYYKDTNTTYTFYNLQFQNSGGTTVDTYKPTTSPTKTLKAGSNVTISATSNVITIASTDTNTWRGIQDNLTSSSNTTESLSAKQGYLLANGSARDSTKLPLSGGTMSGNITMGANSIVFNQSTTSNWNVAANTGIMLLNTVGASATGAPGTYHIGLSVSGYYGFQLATYGGGGRLLFRNTKRENYPSWSEIAFLSDITKNTIGLGNVANYDQSKAIKSITRSGTTFTYTALDGTTGTFTQQDNNTTYNFSGTTFRSGYSSAEEHNANNAWENGHYYYTSNGPSGLGNSTSDGALYVQSYNSSWVGQIAQDYRNGRLWVRGKNNGTWQSWIRIANYNEIPSSLPANGGNADTVDNQHFKWSNDSNSPTYLWAANSSGTAFLCARGSMSVNYANSAGNADTVDSEHASAFAHRQTWNNMVHSGNEYTWIAGGYNGGIWINYRTASGSCDGNITQYIFGNGKGGSLASITSGTFNGNCTGSAGSVAWGNVTGKPSTFAPSSHTHDYLPLSGGSLTGLLSVRNTGNTAAGQYNQGAMQIREYNYGGSQSDTWGNAPRLTWHWSGRVAAQIGLGSNGYLYEAPATGTNFYRLVYESGTWGINVSGSAGSVAWSNVSGRPTNLNQFTNGPGYITSSGSCSYATTAGTANSVAFNNIANNPFISLFISTNQTRGTGINVNAREGGRTLLILMSGQCDSGNATASRIYMVRCGYSGNNYNLDELHSRTGNCYASLTASVSSSGELQLKANSGQCYVAIYQSRFE